MKSGETKGVQFFWFPGSTESIGNCWEPIVHVLFFQTSLSIKKLSKRLLTCWQENSPIRS